jgi:hypothetical protein
MSSAMQNESKVKTYFVKPNNNRLIQSLVPIGSRSWIAHGYTSEVNGIERISETTKLLQTKLALNLDEQNERDTQHLLPQRFENGDKTIGIQCVLIVTAILHSSVSQTLPYIKTRRVKCPIVFCVAIQYPTLHLAQIRLIAMANNLT